MNKNKYYSTVPFILILYVLIACKTYRQPLSTAYLSILDKKEAPGNYLRFNSIYRQRQNQYHIAESFNNGKPDKYLNNPYLDNPLILSSDGKIFYSNSVWADSASFNQYFMQARKKSINTGVYEIVGDTLKAIVSIIFQHKFKLNIRFNGLSEARECYFVGTIKNKDTILQWHMISKVAELDTSIYFNNFLYHQLITPKDLYYSGIITNLKL